MAFPELKVQYDCITYRTLQRRNSVRLGFRVTYHLDMLKRRDGFGEALANDRRVFNQENSERVCRVCARF